MSSAFVILPTNEVVSVGVILVVNTATPGGGGATNLAYTAAPTQGTVTSDTGTDATLPLATGTNAGLMAPAQFTKLGHISVTQAVDLDAMETKLAGIETGADVTDAANVDAAGAVMNSDATTAAMQFVIDEDSFASNLDTKIPTQQSVKAYADAREVAAKSYADTLVVGLVDDRGNYDASVNTFPASGGSGTAGAVLKGDLWTVSVAGTLGGTPVTAGDLVRALVDTPGQTAANWAVTENNIGYVAENQSNKSTDVVSDQGSNVKYPSVKAVYDWGVAAFQALSSALTNLSTKWTPASASASASLQFHEDTDNGSHKITLIANASLSADRVLTLPDKTGDIFTDQGGQFQNNISVPDDAYGAGWNGSADVPTKNALYDKIETLGGASNAFSPFITEYFIDYFQVGTDISVGHGFANGSSGAGAQVAFAGSEEGHNGIVTIHAGTTTTGRGLWYHPKDSTAITIRDAALTMWPTVRLNTAVSDGTDTYTIKHGLLQSYDGEDANGIYLYYNKDVNGGNWTVRMRRASTTELELDTGVAASSSWATFRIVVAKADQAITVYDESGTQLATGTPSARIASGQQFFMAEVIKKSAGTNNRTYSSDRYYLKIDRT